MLLTKKYSIIIVTMCHIRFMSYRSYEMLAAAMTLSPANAYMIILRKNVSKTASVEVSSTGAWPTAHHSGRMGVMMYPGVSPDYFRFDMPLKERRYR